MRRLARHFRRHLVGYVALTVALSPAAYAGTRADAFSGSNAPPKVRARTFTVQPGQVADTIVGCRGKRHATGGGVALFTGENNMTILVSAPAVLDLSTGFGVLAPSGTTPNAWKVRVNNTGTSPGMYRYFVICSS